MAKNLTAGRIFSILLTWFTAACVAMTAATQLRFGRLPIGLGELGLLLCMAAAAWSLVTNGTSVLAGSARDMTLFWLFTFAIIPCGVIWGLVSGRSSPDFMSHDLVALMFTGTATIAFAVLLSRTVNWSSLALAYIVAAAYPLALLWRIVPSTGSFGPIDPWLDDRFQGWAENPNQLATLLQPAPFLVIALWRDRPGFARKAVLFATLGVAIAVGLATKSDALWVSWVAGTLAFVALSARRAIVDRTRRMTLSRAARVSVAAMFGAVILVTAVTMSMSTVVQAAQNLSSSDHNQGQDRLTLWGNAVGAIVQSPVVGFGPGTFSGESGPFEKKEAHNSFLDWGMSTGLLGVIAFLNLIGRSLRRALRSSSVLPGAALLSLLAFASFHYTFRQPTFWLGLILVIMMPAVASVEQSRAPQST